MFTLCPRGYGLNSFRIAEAIQYGSIPVYISDEFILPYAMDFEKIGVLIRSKDAHKIDEILQAIEPWQVVAKQDRLQDFYEKYYTFPSNMNLIKQHLETECNLRKSQREASATV